MDVTFVGVQIDYVYDRAICNPHQNKDLGWFKITGDLETHVYGTEDPPIPNACMLDVLGPKPGQALETLRSPLETCNTYCGPDPNQVFGPEKDSSCVTCAKHGDWNRTAYHCECHDRWTLRDSGEVGVYGEAVYLCDKCQGFWGPNVPGDEERYTENDNPYCRKIWTPDPETGIERECSGHGEYVFSEQCSCFGNSTHGWWELDEITHTFTELEWDDSNNIVEREINRTVSTCYKCQWPYFPDPLLSQKFPMPVRACSRKRFDTLTPTASPIVNDTNLNNTLDDVCEFGCFDPTINEYTNAVVDAILYPLTFLNLTELSPIVPNITECGNCNLTFSKLYEDPFTIADIAGTLMYNLSNICDEESIQTVDQKNNLAFRMCQTFDTCETASWYSVLEFEPGNPSPIDSGFFMYLGRDGASEINMGTGEETAGGITRCFT
ncbi:MAG: hypothetical protein ACTSUE_00685 [Promethearchaeota archaeon]